MKSIGVVLAIVVSFGLGNLSTALAQDGTALYNSDCAMCHGSLKSFGKRSAGQIQSAINGNRGGMGFLSSLSSTDVAAIAAALNNTPPPAVHVSGTVAGVSGATVTVTVAGTPTAIPTNGSTAVTIAGQAGTVAGLKAGMTVAVTEVGGTATVITATVPIVSVKGTITAVNGSQVTVQTATTPVTFTTDANTIVTVAAKAATPAELEAGMKVTATTALGVATKIAAAVPIVHVNGTITAINGVNITVQTATAPVTFDTDSATVVTVTAKAATLADLKVGMKVTSTTALGTATLIRATIPLVHVAGPITAINSTQVTVQTTAAPVTFDTGSATVITVKAKAATLADLEVGMKVSATTALGVATKIAATVPVVHVTGSITAINGLNITVQTATAPVTFDTDTATVVTVKAKAATPADLKVGMKVIGTTALGTATIIRATVPVVNVAGTITAINGADVTVQGTATPTTFTTDANTKVFVSAKLSTLASVTVGMTLTATTELGTATTIHAKP